MKTPMQELIHSVSNMAKELDRDELYHYFMDTAKEMLKQERNIIETAFWQGKLKSYEVSGRQYYNETFDNE